MIYPRYIMTKSGFIGTRTWPSENHYCISREHVQREADEWELSIGGNNIAEVTERWYKEVDKYSKYLLKTHHCSDACYRNESMTTIRGDIERVYPDGLEYPVEAVVCSIHRMHNSINFPEPSQFHMVYDTGDAVSGIEHETFDGAKADVFDTLCEWQSQFSGSPDDWDMMIEESSTHVTKYNPETEEYDDYWFPSEEELRNIYWVRYDELPDEVRNVLWPDKNKEENP